MKSEVLMNRRRFLRASAAGLVAPAAAGYAAGFADQKPLRAGVIGCGWYGKVDMFRLIQVAPVEIVSLCDVDGKVLADCAEQTSQRQASKKRPRTFTDYREMLREKDLDLILVETPDHWHALQMIEAAKGGADIYVQKPLSLDVVEGQAMLAAARKYQRVVQVALQRRSTPHLAEARDIVQQGKLGTIGHAEIFAYVPSQPTYAQPAAAPETLDWDLWLGPAPRMPYSPEIQERWRAFMEFGNGTIGDLGIHMFDAVRWFLDLGWPKRISSAGGIRVLKSGKSNIADEQTALFEYDNLTVEWKHRLFGARPDPDYDWGGILYGDRGTLKFGLKAYDFIPAGGAQTVHKDVTYELEQYPEDRTEKRLGHSVAPAIRYHLKDLLAHIATRGRPVADIEEGYISSTSCILANLSMRLGRTLQWDAAKGLVVGDEEANRLLRRPYRRPWVHAEVGSA